MALVTQKVPQSRGDRHFFSSSDDNAMMKQIQATHAPDGREVEVKPFLHIIEDIFKRAGFGIPGFIQVCTLTLYYRIMHLFYIRSDASTLLHIFIHTNAT